MRVRLSRLAAVTFYEIVIHWRRRGLPLVIVFFAAISLMNGLAFWVLKRDLFIGFLTTDPPLMLLILAMPIIVADTIPKDRQFLVRELLHSLPMSSGVYLIGKLLGVWILILDGLSGRALRVDWVVTSWFLQSENNPGAMDSRCGAFGALYLRNGRVVVIWSTYAPQSNFSGRGLRVVLLVYIRNSVWVFVASNEGGPRRYLPFSTTDLFRQDNAR